MASFGAFPLANKIVVVTGGGSGINLAFVRHALSLEARVIVADLKLTDEAQELVHRSPHAAFQKCNVARWQDLEDLVGVATREFGDVPDVYVAGAGVFEPVCIIIINMSLTTVKFCFFGLYVFLCVVSLGR
jgi:NAD(P)-dependent dehydrogenase (short-subunit alcohol dehydrogenase family)